MSFWSGFDVGDVISGVGAIASGIGGIFGAQSAADATGKAAGAMEDNAEKLYELQKMLLDAQLADVVDARGNRVTYDEEKGEWRISLSDGTQQLITASDAEELARLTQDMPAARRGRQANEGRRGTEGQLADEILREYRGGSPYTLEGVRGDLTTQAVRNINDAYEGMTSDVLRQAVRSGTSGDAIVAQLAKSRGKNTSDAVLDARVQAPQLFEALDTSWGARKLGDYNVLASRASNYDDTPFAPTGLANTLTGVQGNRAAMLPGGIATAGQLAGSAGGLLSDAAKTLGAGQENLFNTYGIGFNALAQALGSLFEEKKTKTATGLGNQGAY